MQLTQDILLLKYRHFTLMLEDQNAAELIKVLGLSKCSAVRSDVHSRLDKDDGGLRDSL